MARQRQRVRLQDGLWLDLNKLLREGLGPPGSVPWPVEIRWKSNLSGELAKGWMTFSRGAEDRGSLRIVIGKLDQRLELIAQPRHFGGQQWYFRCPVTSRNCSVVWLPPDANRFCSRQAWGKDVAYSTQFESPFDRAISARQKVKLRLIGELASQYESRSCHGADLHKSLRTCWLRDAPLFRSLRHKFDPLDREILERTFDAAFAAVKGDECPVDFDSDEGLEAILRRELIEIACITGVSDPETLKDRLLVRLPPVRPAPTAG
jgi:hypothetical protein